MTTPVDSPSYATVDDFELRTGIDVPDEQEPMIQQRLDDYSALMALYMGPCAEVVETSYPDILTALCCSGVQRAMATTPGIRSETVGATSVAYDMSTTTVAGVAGSDVEVLDQLMAACCPAYSAGGGSSVGQLGVAYDRHASTASDQLWVLSRW